MSERIRISGKDLGAVALPGFCPRCFWIQRRAPAGLPFQSFPGIFSSIDAYTKRVVHSWIDQHQRMPAWLDEVGPITGYREPPHHSKFSVVDSQTDILLTGAVDGVFVRPDLSHIIIDYKTARYTSAQGALFPVYKTQLNAYALIGEARGGSPVSALALVYAEPVTDQAAASHGTTQRNGRWPLDRRDAATCHEAEHEQDQKDEEQNSGNIRCGSSHADETEDTGNKCN